MHAFLIVVSGGFVEQICEIGGLIEAIRSSLAGVEDMNGIGEIFVGFLVFDNLFDDGDGLGLWQDVLVFFGL